MDSSLELALGEEARVPAIFLDPDMKLDNSWEPRSSTSACVVFLLVTNSSDNKQLEGFHSCPEGTVLATGREAAALRQRIKLYFPTF